MILVLAQHLRTKMADNKDLVLGSIQFSPDWERFLSINQKINDGVALNMYKALKGIVRSKKLMPYKSKDLKAFARCLDALVQYEISYNKN